MSTRKLLVLLVVLLAAALMAACGGATQEEVEKALKDADRTDEVLQALDELPSAQEIANAMPRSASAHEIGLAVSEAISETLNVQAEDDAAPEQGGVASAITGQTESGTAGSGTTGETGDCRLDKVATFAEIPGGPHRMEVSGGGGQHVDYYPEVGVKSVSFVLPAIMPAEVPSVWYGYGSIWEGNGPECVGFDYVTDATQYAAARMDSGHSGLVVDLQSGTAEIVANVADLSDAEVAELMRQFAVAETAELDAEPGDSPTPVSAAKPVEATCPEGDRADHPSVNGETWKPGPASTWRIVNFWTNWEGFDQAERKLLLAPSQNPVLKGGGSVWSWPENCESVAHEEFEGNSLPEVTLQQLRNEGLVQ